MLPVRGPSIYRVRGVTNVSIPAATTLGPIRFRFPRAVFVTGVQLLVRSGNPADLAVLDLRISDETFQETISDGQGGVFSAPGVALASLRGWHPFRLQHPVAAGDEWIFRVENTRAAGAAVTPLLFLLFDEPRNVRRVGSTLDVYGGKGGTA